MRWLRAEEYAEPAVDALPLMPLPKSMNIVRRRVTLAGRGIKVRSLLLSSSTVVTIPPTGSDNQYTTSKERDMNERLYQ